MTQASEEGKTEQLLERLGRGRIRIEIGLDRAGIAIPVPIANRGSGMAKCVFSDIRRAQLPSPATHRVKGGSSR